MGRLIKIIMLVVLIATLAYLGTCIYGNFFAPGVNSGVDMPDSKDARYSLVVKNTATVILTNDYEIFGDDIGKRIYILHGYWELVGNEFKYYKGDITLPEEVFGEINIKIRG